VIGIRAAIRAALYQAHKYTLGCPTEAKCALYEKSQEEACATCAKHLTPVEPQCYPEAGSYIRYLTRLEQMVAVGCSFHVNDLSLDTWDGLAALSLERQRMENLLVKRRMDNDKAQREAGAKVAEVRKADKIPPPGQPLFPRGAR
jgi:hypothetical protein